MLISVSPELLDDEYILPQEGVFGSNEGCLQSHHLNDSPLRGATPSQRNVFNREITVTDFSQHSPALKTKKALWSDDNLVRFLSTTETFAPGNAMQTGAVYTEEDAQEIISVLKTIN